MTDPDSTTRAITQGQALVRAIEAMGTIEPSGLFERTIAGLLLAGHKRRVRAIIGLVPAWAGEETLGESHHQRLVMLRWSITWSVFLKRLFAATGGTFARSADPAMLSEPANMMLAAGAGSDSATTAML